MNALKLVIASILLIGCNNLLAAKAPKVLVCHVGGEGEINLILVSANSSHLGNASHSFGTLMDYEPSEVGAAGEGSEDIDGDGVDEGCEPPAGLCPCWEAIDLLAVDGNNQDDYSCNIASQYPLGAFIQNDPTHAGSSSEVEGGFQAGDFGEGNAFCFTRDFGPYNGIENLLPISSEEAQACINLIVTQCAAIGTPISIPSP